MNDAAVAKHRKKRKGLNKGCWGVMHIDFGTPKEKQKKAKITVHEG